MNNNNKFIQFSVYSSVQLFAATEKWKNFSAVVVFAFVKVLEYQIKVRLTTLFPFSFLFDP